MNYNRTGWAADRVETEAFAATVSPLYGDQLENLPFEKDRSAYPFRFLARALSGSKNVRAGRLVAIHQGTVGSCVGCMGSRVADITAASDIYQRRERETWPRSLSTSKPIISSPEYCYAASRQVTRSLGRWDGSTGSGMARAFQEIGTAYQRAYGISADLSQYSSQRARTWARRGVPDEVIEAAREHPFRATVRVTTADHACALVQNGYGVGVCSGLAFSSRRDRDGFSRRVRPGWSHAMAIVGYHVSRRGRRGFIFQNSWGSEWIEGPEPLDDFPEGSFVADWDDTAVALSSGDCWSYGGFKGFAISPFDWKGGLGW